MGADRLVVRAVHVRGGVGGAVTGVGEHVGGVDRAVLGFLRLHVLWPLIRLVVQGPHAPVKQWTHESPLCKMNHGYSTKE